MNNPEACILLANKTIAPCLCERVDQSLKVPILQKKNPLDTTHPSLPHLKMTKIFYVLTSTMTVVLILLAQRTSKVLKSLERPLKCLS